eukprot:scaffold162438_cov14-Prasinocladus_malaysianus.AAC.1
MVCVTVPTLVLRVRPLCVFAWGGAGEIGNCRRHVRGPNTVRQWPPSASLQPISVDRGSNGRPARLLGEGVGPLPPGARDKYTFKK